MPSSIVPKLLLVQPTVSHIIAVSAILPATRTAIGSGAEAMADLRKIMKTQRLVATLTVAIFAAGLTGCGKKEEPVSNAASETQKGTGDAGAAVQNTAEAARATAEKAAIEVKQQAEAAATSATAKAQELIDKAKALVSDKKYQDALAALKQTANLKLTPEQQKLVDDLKATITTALGSSGVGNLLNK